MTQTQKTSPEAALHQPVMLEETVQALRIKADSWYVDGTFGRGGHTRKILELGGKVIAIDHDQEAIEYGQIHFQKEVDEGRLRLIRANFAQLENTLTEQFSNKTTIAGILFDFGTSVDQLTNQERGFSFTGNGPLDMRMDDRLGVTAAQLLAVLNEEQLTEAFKTYGGEESARAIAKAIVSTRTKKPIQSTQELVKVVERVKRHRGKLHPATKVFQALRIVVNSELESIAQVLPAALRQLSPGGALVCIAFHEGEDRLVKQFFKVASEKSLGSAMELQKPTSTETSLNPRARSAKLRVFYKSEEPNN